MNWDLLAVYAAIVGTVAIIWDVMKWVKGRRPKVWIHATFNVGGVPSLTNERFIMVDVVNAGSRPVTLEYLTFRFFRVKPRNPMKATPDESGQLLPQNLDSFSPPLPYKLGVGEKWAKPVRQDPMMKEFGSGWICLLIKVAQIKDESECPWTLEKLDQLQIEE